MIQQPQTDQEQLYFAAREKKACAMAVLEKKRVYERFVESAGLQRVWRKMHWRFYGADPERGHTNHQVNRDGQEGELHLINMNHLRADVTLWLTLAFSQRAEMQPEAVGAADYAAELEVKRASALLSYYGDLGDIETQESLAGEYAGVYGMAWIMRWWNPRGGDLVMPPASAEDLPEGHQPAPGVYTGSVEAHALSPMDTFVDPFCRTARQPWIICRVPRNRYDLIAQHPELRDQIAAFAIDEQRDNLNRVDLLSIARSGEGKTGRDEVPVLYFFHEKTPAMPNGRVLVMLSPDVVLEDFALVDRFDRVPVQRLAPAEIHRTPFGFSPAWGLLAPQEAQQTLSSIALTNATTFGLGVIVSPKGNDVDDRTVAEGLTLVEYTPGLEAPKALTLPTTPQEVYAFRNALVSEMGTLVGVNSVVRGDPEASLKSGSALALVQAQAVQFSNDFQHAIVLWRERHHFDTIAIAQKNLNEAIMPVIAGDYTSSLLAAFSGKDISRIKRVKIKAVNPMAKTLAGKVQIADTLAERFQGQFSPGDYMRVLETGSIEHMTKGETQRRANLDRENELLAAGIGPVPMEPQIDPATGEPVIDPMSGEPAMVARPVPGKRYVRALITDDHRAHVQAHLEVLDNPAVRESTDPAAQAVIDAVLAHVEEHEELAVQASTQRLVLLELTNQPPLRSALPPVDPGADPGAGGGGPPQKKGPPGGSPADVQQPTPPGANQLPRAAQMPVNPSTGQRVEEMPGPT